MPYGSARLPQGNAIQFEVEKVIDQVKTEKGTASVFPDLFWSKDVLIFKADGPGSRIEIPFEVEEAGDYELYTQIAMGSDYGIYNVLLDGKPPVAPVLEHEPGADVRPELSFDGYAYETYVGRDYQVGWPRLTKGRHTLTYVCLGKNAASTGYVLGVDNIVLAQVGAAGWAKAANVKPPVVPTDLAGATRALSDPDPVVRGLAARELRNMGAAAAPATDALAARLKDSDWIVRMAAAEALTAIGPKAAPAVPALTAAAGQSGENVNVVRACAEALGAIGPAAKSAVPVLQAIAAKPILHVNGVIERSPSYAAEQAIREDRESREEVNGERAARLFYSFCVLAGAAVLAANILSAFRLVPIRGGTRRLSRPRVPRRDRPRGRTLRPRRARLVPFARRRASRAGRASAFAASEWTLRGLCVSTALAFLATEVGKLAHDAEMRSFFTASGYPVWFLYAVIAFETLCSVGLLEPRVRLVAASGLALDMVGAIVTHARNGDPVSDSFEAMHLLATLVDDRRHRRAPRARATRAAGVIESDPTTRETR